MRYSIFYQERRFNLKEQTGSISVLEIHNIHHHQRIKGQKLR